MTGAALSLGLLLLAPRGTPPPVERGTDGFLLLRIPDEPLDDPDIRRRLLSGLTTTIELHTELETDGREVISPEPSSIDIRYDLWDEVLHVRRTDVGRSPVVQSIESTDAMKQWLKTDPLRIVSLQGVSPGAVLHVKVTCLIIPFSKAEEARTKEWFSNALRAPSSGSTGQGNLSRQRRMGGEGDKESVFAQLMSTGIRRHSIRTYQWSWTLPAR